MATLSASENAVLQKLLIKITSEKPIKAKEKKETYPEGVARMLNHPIFK